MKRMILAKGLGAALALTLMAGFAGQASAGLREYCASYARDVAHRKTNGGADLLVGANGRGTGAIIGNAGGTVLGAGTTSDRYKRAYANAYDRCVANYEGTREPDATVQAEPPEQKAAEKKTAVSELSEKKVAASDATEKKVVADEVAEQEPAVSEPTEKKVTVSKPVQKKVAAIKPTEKKVAVNEAVDKDKACARKYRSYDPQVGKYKSYTGKWRTCRL
jgi:hypothetical protein